MSQFANVTSITSLAELKASFATFTSEACEALSSLEMEIRRSLDWLQEQLKYWQATVRKCEDEVFQAKQELARRKMMRISDRPLDTTEQEKALRKARARLEHAEEKVKATRQWLRKLPEEIINFEGPARQLAGMLDADMPKIDALLERKITALEAYVQTESGPAPSAASVARPAAVAETDPAAAAEAVAEPERKAP
jgi:chromosome segregation ATPase